jgi:ATP-dependent helicase HrpA
MQHNAALLRRAMAAQAKLRRRDVLADVSQRAAFFERVLPPEVCDGHSLLSALAADARVQGAGPKGAGLQEKLRLKEEDCLTQSAKRALDEELFPSSLALARGVFAEVRYAFAPGKEEDGVTFVLPLLALPEVSDEAFAWLVPGMRSELFGAMLKSLPKAARAEIERSAGASIDDAAAQLAELAK